MFCNESKNSFLNNPKVMAGPFPLGNLNINAKHIREEEIVVEPLSRYRSQTSFGMNSNQNQWLSIVWIFMVVASESLVSSQKINPRIVGGQVTSIRKMEYIVYMRRYGTFACGGALVSPRYVVSAAHCVAGYPTSAITITGGTSYLNNGGITRRVLRVFVPAGFTTRNMRNDVAVLKLATPLAGANIATIPLCSHNLPVGASLRISGWGVQAESSTRTSMRLRTTFIKLRSRRSCRRSYGNAFTNSMMCAAANGRDTCWGDSGGPVVHNGQLCGIVSWGNGCARTQYPGVYTIVNRVKSFIQQSMNK